MPTQLLLARHGAIDWSGRVGAPDDGLNDLGRRQAEALGRRLARHQVAALYSSTLRRAAETAEIIGRHLGLEVRWEPRLREWDPGDWMGLLEDEVKAQYPGEWERLQSDADFTPPGGETFSQLQGRVSAAAEEIAAAHPDQPVVLVSHGGALSSLICHVVGLDFEAATRLYLKGRQPFAVDYCSLSTVELSNPVPVLLGLNDTCHLEGPSTLRLRSGQAGSGQA